MVGVYIYIKPAGIAKGGMCIYIYVSPAAMAYIYIGGMCRCFQSPLSEPLPQPPDCFLNPTAFKGAPLVTPLVTPLAPP